jgi:hypothetical protein
VVFCISIGGWGVLSGSIMLPFTMAVVYLLAQLEYANALAENEENKKSELFLEAAVYIWESQI